MPEHIFLQVHFNCGPCKLRKQHIADGFIFTSIFICQCLELCRQYERPMFLPIMQAQDNETMEKNIQQFEERCVKNNVGYHVRKDFFDLAFPALKKEIRYADLLILQ